MAELVDAADSKSVIRKDVGVRLSPGAPIDLGEDHKQAKSLYADVELDQFIPETLYKIIAEIIKKVINIG